MFLRLLHRTDWWIQTTSRTDTAFLCPAHHIASWLTRVSPPSLRCRCVRSAASCSVWGVSRRLFPLHMTQWQQCQSGNIDNCDTASVSSHNVNRPWRKRQFPGGPCYTGGGSSSVWTCAAPCCAPSGCLAAFLHRKLNTSDFYADEMHNQKCNQCISQTNRDTAHIFVLQFFKGAPLIWPHLFSFGSTHIYRNKHTRTSPNLISSHLTRHMFWNQCLFFFHVFHFDEASHSRSTFWWVKGSPA